MNNLQNNKIYDLEKRTLLFSIEIIKLVKLLRRDFINEAISKQLIRSATSIGANYREANETITKKDFKHKIALSRKEAKETIYWIDLLKSNNSILSEELIKVLNEAKELLKIFAKISIKMN